MIVLVETYFLRMIFRNVAGGEDVVCEATDDHDEAGVQL